MCVLDEEAFHMLGCLFWWVSWFTWVFTLVAELDWLRLLVLNLCLAIFVDGGSTVPRAILSMPHCCACDVDDGSND